MISWPRLRNPLVVYSNRLCAAGWCLSAGVFLCGVPVGGVGVGLPPPLEDTLDWSETLLYFSAFTGNWFFSSLMAFSRTTKPGFRRLGKQREEEHLCFSEGLWDLAALPPSKERSWFVIWELEKLQIRLNKCRLPWFWGVFTWRRSSYRRVDQDGVDMWSGRLQVRVRLPGGSLLVGSQWERASWSTQILGQIVSFSWPWTLLRSHELVGGGGRCSQSTDEPMEDWN